MLFIENRFLRFAEFIDEKMTFLISFVNTWIMLHIRKNSTNQLVQNHWHLSIPSQHAQTKLASGPRRQLNSSCHSCCAQVAYFRCLPPIKPMAKEHLSTIHHRTMYFGALMLPEQCILRRKNIAIGVNNNISQKQNDKQVKILSHRQKRIWSSHPDDEKV